MLGVNWGWWRHWAVTLSRWLCLPHTSFVSLLVGVVKERTFKASVRKNEKSRGVSPVPGGMICLHPFYYFTPCMSRITLIAISSKMAPHMRGYRSFRYKFIHSSCKKLHVLSFKNEEYSPTMFFFFRHKLYLKWSKFLCRFTAWVCIETTSYHMATSELYTGRFATTIFSATQRQLRRENA